MAQFISKYREFKVLVKASKSKEVNGNLEVVPGKSINFENGFYSTEDPVEIKFLENHPEFGKSVYRIKENENARVAKLKGAVRVK